MKTAVTPAVQFAAMVRAGADAVRVVQLGKMNDLPRGQYYWLVEHKPTADALADYQRRFAAGPLGGVAYVIGARVYIPHSAQEAGL